MNTLDLSPSIPVPPRGQNAKALGAYYTDVQVAEFLVWWALRTSRDEIMDPSFGGGVFIRAACNRVIALGGKPINQVFGVEFDPQVHCLITEKLGDEFGIRRNLWRRDFFDLEPLPVNKVNVIVGNPPFIRYQRFANEARSCALAQATEQGVRLNQLSSSWAPFVIHSIAMLKRGGRLAMVVPMEIGHAGYARPVLKHLQDSFAKVTFVTFRKKLFPSLSQDTLLVLAEDRGSSSVGFLHRDLAHAGVLADIQSSGRIPLHGTRRIESSQLVTGSQRIIEYLVPKKARDLYRDLKVLSLTRRLGEIVDVGIGYVTGNNDFFHLSPAEISAYSFPREFLRPAVRRGRALEGLRFTRDDWETATTRGEGGYLLHIPKEMEVPTSVRRYLDYGMSKGVPRAYKCRTRSPWYSVPHVHEPDGFLTYMSGTVPRLVTNEAGAVAPNSLHMLRMHDGIKGSCGAITALWQTSLTRLSTELEGHAMGGGMLKLEPSEAGKCIVAAPELSDSYLVDFARDLDTLVRANKEKIAQERADKVILQKGLGLSWSDCQILREAGEQLANRRFARSTNS